MRTLLVVDDEPAVRRSFTRLFARIFDRVLVASDADEAEDLLEAAEVTHLVCDLWLGDPDRTGDVLIGRWRERHPSIAYAALVTATYVSRPHPALRVDRVFRKPFDPRSLREALAAS